MSNTPFTPQAPYYDDFDNTKKFLRMLFRPSIAVQARELTQMQTILQEQIGRFGDHVFENGSVVIPGDVIYDDSYFYIKLTGAPLSSPSSYIGQTIARSGDTLVATIVNYKEAEGSDPFTFFVRYTSGDSVNNTQQFNPSESLLINSTESVTIQSPADSVGRGSAVHIKAGVYYFNSTFVLVEDQTVILSKYNTTPTSIVGLVIEEDIVTPEQDITLLDNAAGSLNYTAPGAHRLRIIATLVNKEDLSTYENFIQLISVENGIIKEKARNSNYSVIDQTFARRTYDESGDYVIDPFILSVREHLNDGSNGGVYTSGQGGDATKLALEFDPGKAYVRGYEVETISNTILATDKARETAVANNSYIYQPSGNYFIVEFDTPSKADIDFSTDYPLVEFYNNTPTKVAEARIRYIRHDAGSNFRLYVFDYTVTGPGDFSATGNRVKAGSTFDASLTSTQQQETSNKTAVFQLPFGVVSSVSGIVFEKVKQLGGAVAGNQVTINSGLGTGESLFSSDSDAYAVIDANDNIFYATNVVLPTLTLSGSPTAPVRVVAPVRKSNGSQKSKTRLTTTAAGVDTDAEISLGKADIFQINSILGPGGEDLSEYYTLDNGQRDMFYDIGKVVKKPGVSIPVSGAVTVNFDYFSHGSGEFFVRGSYPGTVDYEDIPVFKASNGRELPLANCIDYRPRINDADTGFTGTGASFNESVLPNSTAFFDFEYYLGRIDKVVLSQDGEFAIIKGTPAITPVEPADQDNAITLYKLTLGAYTFSKEDVKVEYIDHRRYTMRDIGNLEKRIDSLEYYTTLSLLEKETFDRIVTDENGVELFKLGLVVDRFSGHQVGDTQNPDYAIAMDLEVSEARPESETKAVDLDLNTGASSNYTLHSEANVITLPYTEVEEVEQPLASKLIGLNTFKVHSWNGTLKLSPENDFWHSRRIKPDVVTNPSGIFDCIKYQPNNETKSKEGQIWNNWLSIWTGLRRDARENGESSSSVRWKDVREVRETTLRVTQSQNNESYTGVRSSGVNRTDRKFVGDRVISTSIVPYCRERNVDFSATGMKPLTRVYPFFNGVDVSAYCKPSGGSLGNAIITDSLGNVSGTFSIPNRAAIRFRSGDRLFKLTDSPTNDDDVALTTAASSYRAKGLLNTKRNGYVSVREGKVVRGKNKNKDKDYVLTSSMTTRSTTIGWNDPVAQSFLVDIAGGAYITSLDLFFGSTVSGDFPVTVQIRTMSNGVPGTEIVPFGESTVQASEINAYDDSAINPADKFVATKFNFPAPVYLQENTEYCFVIMSNNTGLGVWAAEMGQVDLLTNQQITKQPYAGLMFKSQNGSSWIPDLVSDIKFNLNRASFSGTSTLRFDNAVKFNDAGTEADPFLEVLDFNPFNVTEPTPGTAQIVVTHKNHGFTNGDLVTFDIPASTTTFNGIPSSDVDGNSFSVSNVTVDSYTISFAHSAGSGNVEPGFGGGADIIATQKVSYSVAEFMIQQLIHTGTDIAWSFKGTNKGGSSLDSVETPVVPNETMDFGVVKTIGDATDQSLQVFGVMTTTKENLSPVVDLDRIAILATTNRINTISTADLADELNPSGGPAIAKYITRPITLTNAADRLTVYIDANRPSNTRMKVYAKLVSEGAFADAPYQLINVDGAEPGETSDPRSFNEYRYVLTSSTPFTQFAIKVILYVDESVTDQSAIQAKVPRMRDLRAIAVAT